MVADGSRDARSQGKKIPGAMLFAVLMSDEGENTGLPEQTKT
jgi:hypothetical protein